MVAVPSVGLFLPRSSPFLTFFFNCNRVKHQQLCCPMSQAPMAKYSQRQQQTIPGEERIPLSTEQHLWLQLHFLYVPGIDGPNAQFQFFLAPVRLAPLLQHSFVFPAQGWQWLLFVNLQVTSLSLIWSISSSIY